MKTRVLNEYELAVDAAGGFDDFSSAPRREIVHRYAWAIPNEEAIDTIAHHGPIVEIGAGGGYWAHLLRNRGVDVVAYDITPASSGEWSRGEPTGALEDFGENGTRMGWTTVEFGDHTAAALHPDRAMMLCWPSYSHTWPSLALAAYLRAGGQKLIYIGEGEGGCTGDDRFHRLMRRWMREVETIDIPQWDGMYDRLVVLAVKEGPSRG